MCPTREVARKAIRDNHEMCNRITHLDRARFSSARAWAFAPVGEPRGGRGAGGREILRAVGA